MFLDLYLSVWNCGCTKLRQHIMVVMVILKSFFQNVYTDAKSLTEAIATPLTVTEL